MQIQTHFQVADKNSRECAAQVALGIGPWTERQTLFRCAYRLVSSQRGILRAAGASTARVIVRGAQAAARGDWRDGVDGGTRRDFGRRGEPRRGGCLSNRYEAWRRARHHRAGSEKVQQGNGRPCSGRLRLDLRHDLRQVVGGWRLQWRELLIGRWVCCRGCCCCAAPGVLATIAPASSASRLHE